MAKKKTTKKKAAKKKVAKKPAAGAKLTKTQIFAAIAEETELTRKQVAAVFDSMSGLIKKQLGRRGPGEFTVPGLMKIVRKNVPAKPKRLVRNPATGEMVWAKPKPATKQVKVRPLKGLKEMVL